MRLYSTLATDATPQRNEDSLYPIQKHATCDDTPAHSAAGLALLNQILINLTLGLQPGCQIREQGTVVRPPVFARHESFYACLFRCIDHLDLFGDASNAHSRNDGILALECGEKGGGTVVALDRSDIFGKAGSGGSATEDRDGKFCGVQRRDYKGPEIATGLDGETVSSIAYGRKVERTYTRDNNVLDRRHQDSGSMR